MKYQMIGVSGPVNKDKVLEKLWEFANWLHLESGASPTEEDPLVITIYDRQWELNK